MTSDEIRQKFLSFFAERGHQIIPSASLVPTDYGDNGTLFTTAGMQPMIPYLLGEPHPDGRRIADVQKCVRTGDIDDVGDNRHLTFFEMMGNWSLGDPDAKDGIGTGYFKKESIPWSFDFLTNKEYGLGLDPARFYVTVFKGLPASGGENGIPRDEESIKIWQEVFTKYGISNEVAGEDEIIKDGVRIIPLGVDDNFWIAGNTGPCGGDTEIFYDVRPNSEDGRAKPEGKFNDLVDSFRLIEVWNNVFMEFNKTPEGKYEPLASKNVDTGMGLERTTAVVNGQSTVFNTDLFAPILSEIKQQVANFDEKSSRIVADHVRTAVFMIADGVTPSNTDRGYILRRIIRRAVRFANQIQSDGDVMRKVAEVVVEKYKKVYPELEKNREQIFAELNKEEEKFRKTLAQGLKEFEKGRDPFDLYQTFGFPIELTEELAKERGITIDREKFDRQMVEHQAVSKIGSEQRFKGGLANDSEKVTKYHTATHLLHSALRQVLGDKVEQKGSNITDERLRFDFAYPTKLTEEQKREVEKIVNDNISADLPVCQIELSKEEAEKTGALHLFGDKYGDKVSIYYIGDKIEDAVSKEFCGGPHAEHTGNLGHFKITKEEASSAGVRRLKAVLE
ncbi:MAG TPA: alanine--tRNA ligase [Candidatus Paceibacterota bacterium]|nr:alanine--tRNA ligase [Candidatus Paceibacterota bacterium]